MVVPVLNPTPAIVTTMNGIKAEFHNIKDRILKKLREFKVDVMKKMDRAAILKFAPVITLAGLVIGILRKPLEFLLMLVGGIIMCFIYALYKITVYPPLNWIIFLVWYIITKVLFTIAYTIVIGVIVAFISLGLMIIALINWASGGKLNKLVLCQNSPLAWYQIPNYHLGNKFERSLFCKSTCATGHTPDELTGEFCDRIGRGQPSYCPQAEIMRIITKHSRSDLKYKYDNYDPTKSFWFPFMTPADKETAYKQYFIRRKKFFRKCGDSLGVYDKMTLDFCSSLDMMEKNKYEGLSEKDIKRLKEVCHQGFCNSRNRYAFCGKYEKNADEEKNIGELIKSIVMFMVICIIFIFILFFTYQFVVSM
jgi:energy-coupling factor transporter transmembrane protein EcfT